MRASRGNDAPSPGGRSPAARARSTPGETTLAFGWEENEKKELAENAGGRPVTTFRQNRRDAEPPAVQISFIADDVQTAFARAVAAGATEVYAPVKTSWGQWVSRVRDLNGVLVSIVTAPNF